MPKSDSRFSATVWTVMNNHLRTALVNAYGQLCEQGYAGYPGSSQGPDADDPFGQAADALTDDALAALEEAGLVPEVGENPGVMKQVPASWVPVIDEDLQRAYYDVKRMMTEQDIAGRLNQYLKDGEITSIDKCEFDDLVDAMDASIDEFGYSNVVDILRTELEERNLLNG